jgi:hypothetical protein
MDLNDLLFEQLESLVTAETNEEIDVALKKSKAVSSIASNIIATAHLTLEAQKVKLEYGKEGNLIPQLENHE